MTSCNSGNYSVSEKRPNYQIFRILISILFLTFFNINHLLGQIVYKDSASIIILGDSQQRGLWEHLYWGYWGENNVEKTKLIFSEISKRNPALLIHLGDMTYDGSTKSEWKKFDEDSKPVSENNILIYPVMGNHEYFGNQEKLSENLSQRFPHLLNFKWYSIIRNGIKFILINSNFKNLTSDEKNNQKNWYSEEIKSAEENNDINFVIICSHHPPFTNNKIVSPNKILQKNYLPQFISSKKSKIFFSGHSHSYERFEKDGKLFIVSGGGGGARHKLNINKQTREFDDKFEGPAIRFFHFCEITKYKYSLILTINKLNENNEFEITDKIILNSD